MYAYKIYPYVFDVNSFYYKDLHVYSRTFWRSALAWLRLSNLEAGLTPLSDEILAVIRRVGSAEFYR